MKPFNPSRHNLTIGKQYRVLSRYQFHATYTDTTYTNKTESLNMERGNPHLYGTGVKRFVLCRALCGLR